MSSDIFRMQRHAKGHAKGHAKDSRLSTAESWNKRKAELRRKMRKCRRELSPLQQRQAARRLYRRVVRSNVFRFSRRLAFTMAHDGEIDPALLLQEAQRRGKECYLPVLNPMDENRLHFKRWRRGHSLQKNQYGIGEPRHGRICPPHALGLVLMPLVAFDADCNRMGMGKGYYDRTFAFLHRGTQQRPKLLGLAHECQRADKLEVAPWDVPLDGVVTDRHWYRPPRGRRQ